MTVSDEKTKWGDRNIPKNHTLYSILENHRLLPGPWFSMKNQNVSSTNERVSWRTFR